jgi:molybdopterin-guanine dinucleotide biosynthesis protein A
MDSLVDTPSNVIALGAILAGGASRRFGSRKAVATVGGVPMIERAAAALRTAGLTPVLIGDHDWLGTFGLPVRGDSLPGQGPLGGLHAALGWARELGLDGAVCVACDLPLLSPTLVRELSRRGSRSRAGAVAAEGVGGRLEPLCAWYSVAALPEIKARLATCRLALIDLLLDLEVERVPLAEVARFGDPSRILFNVNTPSARDQAERLARGEVGTDDEI